MSMSRMGRSVVTAALSVAALFTLTLTSPGVRGELITFTANLDGSQVDGCTGTGSLGTGLGLFVLDTETGIVDYEITFTGLGSAEQAAHVHGPAAPCEFAGIVYVLPFGSPKVGIASLDSAQVQQMVDGLHFVLIHSVDLPGGEIRGQILPDVTDADFIRGDGNQDGTVDVSDAIAGLTYLFVSAEGVYCLDAFDNNDDGQVDIGDMVYLLTTLFGGGLPPASPYPDCGPDPTDDTLTCVSAACP